MRRSVALLPLWLLAVPLAGPLQAGVVNSDADRGVDANIQERLEPYLFRPFDKPPSSVDTSTERTTDKSDADTSKAQIHKRPKVPH